MADEEFYNFDEALRELNLKEEELKRLVSEGEIRAFREGDTMKLRRSDVEGLRSELLGGEVVDLGGSGEELVFEDDLELQEAGMATEEISDMDTLLEEEVEDIGAADLEVELEEGEEAEEARVAVVRRPATPQETIPEGMLVRVLSIVTAVILILAIPLAVSITTGHAGDFAQALIDLIPGVGKS